MKHHLSRLFLMSVIAVLLAGTFPGAGLAAAEASPTTAEVFIDGDRVSFDAYNIGGNNYFKLRDLSISLTSSQSRFEVEWDEAANAIRITSDRPYKPVGGEMAKGAAGTKQAAPTSSTVFINGTAQAFTAFNIGGNNYFKLRDIASAIDFGVAWDAATTTIHIDTRSRYVETLPADYVESAERALDYLTSRLNDGIDSLYVYRDFSSALNRFTVKAKISDGLSELVHDMNENYQVDPYSGDSCIECKVSTVPYSWGGWLFTNGYLAPGETVPRLNFGERDGCGYDLTGATSLTFMVKGLTGTESVEFFVAGLGYDGATGVQLESYPDSNKKISTGFINLTDKWQEYTIDLTGADLSYVGCGFGFVCRGGTGSGSPVFYLDEIRFNGLAEKEAQKPRFAQSYETDTLASPDDRYIQNAAFSYDNALTAMAFISGGRQAEAKVILDAFVQSVKNDRYRPDRIRNAYVYGRPDSFPGWGGRTRLPGFYSQADRTYYEDQYQAGTNVGNSSFVALALMQYHTRFADLSYLNTARLAMDWVLNECADPSGDGFFAGYDGWPESGAVQRFTYKSIEHNIDAYAAFDGLHKLTGETKYKDAAQSALRFVNSMYDDEKGLFYTGTVSDGSTPNRDNIVLDAQVWSALALGDLFTPYASAVDYAVSHMRTEEGGYGFHEPGTAGSPVSGGTAGPGAASGIIPSDDGYWLEGTAFAALTFRRLGMEEEAIQALSAVRAKQLPTGGLPAATITALDTGFTLFTGAPWVYGDNPHIAPAAWYVMAVNDFNPYELRSINRIQ